MLPTGQQKPGELAVLARHYAARPEYAELRSVLEGLALVAEAAYSPQPISAPEVAVMLAVPESWVWEQKRHRRIPFIQPVKGGKVLFDRVAVMRWWNSLPGRKG